VPHPTLRSAASPHSASPWQPSTDAPQSALARRCQGVHRAAATPTPLGEGCRRLRHRLPPSAEDTMARGPVKHLGCYSGKLTYHVIILHRKASMIRSTMLCIN
jgi:hypothetical protein